MAILTKLPKGAEIKIVVVCVVDEDGKILVTRRSETEDNRPGEYETCGGHRESGESVEEAGERECREEMGIPVEIVPGPRVYFSLRDDSDYGVMLLGKPKSKKIKLKKDEHDAYGWLPLGKIKKLNPVPPDFYKEIKKITEGLRVAMQREHPRNIIKGTQAIFENLSYPPWKSVYTLLGDGNHPDLSSFEEDEVPAEIDVVVNRYKTRPGKSELERSVFQNVLSALEDAGLRESTLATDNGDETVHLEIDDPADREDVEESVRAAGLRIKFNRTGTAARISKPRVARIVNRKDGYHVLSEKGQNLGGPYKSKNKAEKRLRQVEYFKHRKGGKVANPRQYTITAPINPNPLQDLKQNLPAGSRVKPDQAHNAVSIQTDDPNQAVQTLNQMQGQPASQGQVRQQVAQPASMTTASRLARRLKRSLSGNLHVEAVKVQRSGERRRVAVRLACGCGGGLPGEIDVPGGDVPIVLILGGDTPAGGEEIEEIFSPRFFEKLLDGKNLGGKELARKYADRIRGVAESSRSAAPKKSRGRKYELSKRKTIPLDPAYQRAVDTAKKKLEKALKSGDEDAIHKARLSLKHKEFDLNTHLNIVKNNRREPGWGTERGLEKSAEEYLEQKSKEDPNYKDWYQRHKPLVESHYGKDREWGGGPDVFLKMLAATSPNRKVDSNVTLAMTAYEMFREAVENGEEPDYSGFSIPAHRKNLDRIVKGLDVKGPKVYPFQLALQGREDAGAVVDVWMARMFYGIDKPNKGQIKHAQEIIRRIADRKGWGLHFTQAILWELIREKWGHAPADFYEAIKSRIEGQFKRASRRASWTDEQIADALVAMIDEASLGDRREKRAASRRGASDSVSLADLPENPRKLVGHGDYVEVLQDRHDPIRGRVDRVGKHHLWVRVFQGRKENTLKGLDWRTRGEWEKFVHRKKGEKNKEVYSAKKRGISASRISKNHDLLVRKKEVPVYGRTPRRASKKVRPERSEDEYSGELGTSVDNLESLLQEGVFETAKHSADESWAHVRDLLKRAFPGLSAEDFAIFKDVWRKVRKRTAGRRRALFNFQGLAKHIPGTDANYQHKMRNQYLYAPPTQEPPGNAGNFFTEYARQRYTPMAQNLSQKLGFPVSPLSLAKLRLNVFMLPAVRDLLKNWGMSDREIDNYAHLRHKQLGQERLKYSRLYQQAKRDGKLSEFMQQMPTWGDPVKHQLSFQEPRTSPQAPGNPMSRMEPAEREDFVAENYLGPKYPAQSGPHPTGQAVNQVRQSPLPEPPLGMDPRQVSPTHVNQPFPQGRMWDQPAPRVQPPPPPANPQRAPGPTTPGKWTTYGFVPQGSNPMVSPRRKRRK